VAHRGVKVNIVCPGYVKTELSLHALTTDAASKNAKMDATTAAGYAPEYFARKALDGVLRDRAYVTVAQRSAVLAMWLKRFFPSLLRRILARRGRKLAAEDPVAPAAAIDGAK